MKADLEIRCFCNRHPLLAVAGQDTNGNGFVHVKTWKGQRLYAEIIITSGTAHIRCRECYRWNKVRIVRTEVTSDLQELPESLVI
jgi:hypothetical protein